MPKLEILLLIDDNENDALLVSRIVRRVLDGVAIVTQTSGEAALDYLRQTSTLPQLVLLELGLPRMDGFEFIRQMREIKRYNPVPVIIVTGMAIDIARAHAAEVAAGYLVKTIDTEEFTKRFKELLTKLGFEI